MLTGIAARAFATAPADEPKLLPVPIEVVADLDPTHWRSSFDLAPDGRHAAYLSLTRQSLPPAPGFYSTTGVPRLTKRTQIDVTDIETGEVATIGATSASAWAPIWSPDSQRLAYFSDEGGAAGLWIWNASTRTSSRVAAVEVRHRSILETTQWSQDSRRLFCKVRVPDSPVAAVPAAPSASIVVRTTDQVLSTARLPSPASRPGERVDVVMIDLQNGTVQHVASTHDDSWFGLSPNFRYLATAVDDRLLVADLKKGSQRTIELPNTDVPGSGWSWSPRSDRIAYRYYPRPQNRDQPISTRLVVVSIADGTLKQLAGERFIASNNANTLLWAPDGRHLYVSGTARTFRDEKDRMYFHDEGLWKFDVRSGHGAQVVDLAGLAVTTIVSRRRRATVWSADAGRSIWLFAEPITNQDPARAGLYRVQIGSGTAERALALDPSYMEESSGNDRTGQIDFNPNDLMHPNDVWLFSTATGAKRQVTRFGAELASYDLGTAKTLVYTWSGERLKTTVLLPPAYEPSDGPLPTIVWLWGFDHSSDITRRFTLPSNNPLLLSTRGYAVLFPDTPHRLGYAKRDIVDTVMRGVDAAIAAGIADPDHLALAGYSFGAYSAFLVLTSTDRFKAAALSGANAMPELTTGYLMQLWQGHGALPPEFEHTTTPFAQGGTPWSQRERYRENSPLYDFDKITTPILIGQGTADGTFVAEAVFASLVRLGKPAELRIYDDDHAISSRANIIDFWQRRLAFFDQHLGITRDALGRRVEAPGPRRLAGQQ